jgi:ribosomal protein L11 methyltransferase
MASTGQDFQQFNVFCEHAEIDSFEIHEFGALGIEILDQNSFRCFFSSNDPNALAAHTYCISRGWRCSEIEQHSARNWVQACSDIWQPIQVNKIKINPILNAAQLVNSEPDTIYIIPGEGFGTGHHPSTRLAIELLQELPQLSIKSALDFGTGNGILAIAASHIFPDIIIDAIDNDACAINNARENIALNNLNHIKLDVSSIETINKSYQLITANIYAEVLCNYESNLYCNMERGGFLILAGIMKSRLDLVEQAFCAPRWQMLKHLSESGWESYLYTAHKKEFLEVK